MFVTFGESAQVTTGTQGFAVWGGERATQVNSSGQALYTSRPRPTDSNSINPEMTPTLLRLENATGMVFKAFTPTLVCADRRVSTTSTKYRLWLPRNCSHEVVQLTGVAIGSVTGYPDHLKLSSASSPKRLWLNRRRTSIGYVVLHRSILIHITGFCSSCQLPATESITIHCILQRGLPLWQEVR